MLHALGRLYVQIHVLITLFLWLSLTIKLCLNCNIEGKNSPGSFSIIAQESEETKCEGGSSQSVLVTLQAGRY